MAPTPGRRTAPPRRAVMRPRARVAVFSSPIFAGTSHPTPEQWRYPRASGRGAISPARFAGVLRQRVAAVRGENY